MPTTKIANGRSTPTFMDPALIPWPLISEVYWMSYKLRERRLYDLGISASQARVLAVLYYAAEPIKLSLVAALLFQETTSITAIVHRLESRGWVVRTRDPRDRRAIGLHLTAAGRKLAEQIVRISRELYDELFASALSAGERRRVDAALRKVRDRGFRLPETDAKLRRAQEFPIWKE